MKAFAVHSQIQNPRSKMLIVPPIEHNANGCWKTDFIDCIEIPI
jgi:hypothetical protein